MYLAQDKIQHINTVSHEGKVVVFGTDNTGKVFYTVKQDGFEDRAPRLIAILRT